MPDFSSVANMAQIAQQRFEAFGGGFSQFINAGFSSVLKIGGDVADIYHKAILEPFNKELEHIRGIDWANPATYTNEINKLTPWKFVIVEGPAKGPVILDSRTQSTVDRFRNKPAGSDGPPGLYDFQEVTPQGTSAEEVRQAHLDERFLRLPNKDTGVYEKTNLIRAGGREAAEDYALKNGLALIAAAADGDQVHALAILQDLLKYGFDKNGEPIRLIPDTAELNERNRTKFYTDGGGVDSYSVDQFVSQLAGMHFAWKNGNDQVKAAAKALMAEWVRVLTENHGRLGPDDGRGTNQFDQMISVDRTPAGAVYGFPALPYLVEDVAREMGLNYSYGSVLTPAADAVGVLKDLVKEMIIEKLGRISWKMENKYAQAGFEITIPLEARRFVAEFAVKQITAAEQFANLYDHLNRALDQIPVQIDIFDWKQNVKEFLLSSIPFANFGMREVALYGMMRGGYDAITALYTTQGSTATATPGHLFFWEALLYGDLHPVGGTLLQAQKEAVHKATAQHRWYNYSLLAGDFAEPVDRLANWPKEWSSEFYLFKSNRAQQDEQFRGTDPAQPQLSYLVLHALGTIAGAVIRP